MEKDNKQLLSVKQAAAFLGVSVPTIRRWAQTKQIIGIKVGTRGDWRFTPSDLSKLVKKPAKNNGEQALPDKFSHIHDLLKREADAIQRLATQQHKHFLGGRMLRDELLTKYSHNHIAIVLELANNLAVEDIKRGTALFKKLGKELARESLADKLTLEEAVDGTIFLKQAIWQKLREKGVLETLTIEDFYQFNFAIGTFCDVLVSKIAFAYHDNYIKTLKEQGQHKDEFMSVATHELKTPVTSLKAFAQVLQRRFAKAGNEKAALSLAKMDAQLNKLTALIGDLLDATRIDAGKLQFHEGYFDFNELVHEIVEEMQLTTERHTLVKKIGSTKIVYGDRTRLGQVMINLISNAIKYSPQSSKIIVTTHANKNTVVFCVQDFGIGIAKEDQSRVFERFQRVGNQSTFGGLGLGLFIASSIIKRHGGMIWVESEKDKGATFCFILPIKGRKIQQRTTTVTKEELQHE